MARRGAWKTPIADPQDLPALGGKDRRAEPSVQKCTSAQAAHSDDAAPRRPAPRSTPFRNLSLRERIDLVNPDGIRLIFGKILLDCAIDPLTETDAVRVAVGPLHSAKLTTATATCIFAEKMQPTYGQ